MVKSIELFNEILDLSMPIVVEEMPREGSVAIPLIPLTELRAHEEEFFSGLADEIA